MSDHGLLKRVGGATTSISPISFTTTAIRKPKPERPGWIPAHITENWDTDPFAYQTEAELMPAGGVHGQLLTYVTEVVRVPLKKQGLMLLVDSFLLYRDSNHVKNRIGPDLLLMEDCFPPPSSYDLDTKSPPRCLIETTSPKSHFKDLQENVPFYFSLGVETYFVIDAITPQKKLRDPIELHLWRKIKGQRYQKIEPDSASYFLLPEMNIKIKATQQRLTFIDASTGEILRDSEQLGEALKEIEQRAIVAEQRANAEEQRANAEEQRANAEKQRANVEAQRANTAEQRVNIEVQRAVAAEQRAETAFETGRHKKAFEIAQNLLAKGIEPTIVAETTGLSVDELATLSSIQD